MANSGHVMVSDEYQLAAALTVATRNVLIALASNIGLTQTIKITDSINVTVDGRGFSIDGGSAVSCFLVKSSNVTFKSLNVINGRSPEGGDGGCISLSSSQLVLDQVNITSCFAKNGGGLISESSYLNMKSCTFSFNRAATSGGAMFIDHNTQVTSFLCHYIGNQALAGGALATFGHLKSTNCVYRANKAVASGGSGGAIYGTNAVEVESGAFIENLARSGAAVYLTVSMQSTRIIPANAIFTNCVFGYNSATTTVEYGGGAVYVIGDKTIRDSLLIVGSQFISNTAQTSAAGAIVLQRFADLILNGCLFNGNYGITSADVYIDDTISTSISVHSTCPQNSYNSGKGQLDCTGCGSIYPSDLYSESCAACNFSEYSCCGSLTCVSAIPSCTSAEVAICASPTSDPTFLPTSDPTAASWQPSLTPTQATTEPTKFPTKIPVSSPTSTNNPTVRQTSSPSFVPTSSSPSTTNSWFKVSMATAIVINLSSVSALLSVLVVSYRSRLGRWPRFSLVALSGLTSASTGLELAFCSSVKLCIQCPNRSGLLLPAASAFICALIMAVLLRRHLEYFDNKALIWIAFVLGLALLDGGMLSWLPRRKTSATVSWNGLPHRSLVAFAMMSVLSRKLPSVIMMWLSSGDSDWESIAFITLSCVAVVVQSIVTSLLYFYPHRNEPEYFARKDSAFSLSVHSPSASDESATDTSDSSDDRAVSPYLHFGNVKQEETSSDGYGKGSTIADPRYQDMAHLPHSRHSFPGTNLY